MLNKIKLKDDVKAVFLARMTNPNAQQQAEVDALAEGISDAIDDFVRGIEISYVSGLVAPNGPVTGTFQYSLN